MSRTVSWVLASVLVIVGLVLLDWQTQPGHGSRGQILQALSLGPGRWMQLAYGAALLALTSLLWVTAFRRPAYSTAPRGLFFLIAASLGVLLSGAFARNALPADVGWPRDYWAHLVGGAAASVLIPLGLLAFARRFYDDNEESLAAWTLIAAILTGGVAVALVLFPPHALAGPTPMMAFAARRAHFLVLAAWCLAISMRLSMRKKTGQEARPEPSTEAYPQATATAADEGFNWEKFAAKIEVLTLPLVLIGGVIALLEYSDGHKRDIREVSKGAYEKADSNWTEFLKLCAEYPETDCYDGPVAASGSGAGSGSNDVAASPRQGVVLSLVVDTFETAYRNYNDAEYANDATENYCDEWPTWMVAMRRYGRRESFVHVWNFVRYEYGKKFQDCMQAVIDEPATTPIDAAPPDACRINVCEYRVPRRDSGSAAKRSAQ